MAMEEHAEKTIGSEGNAAHESLGRLVHKLSL
jgi:hypothetical protein